MKQVTLLIPDNKYPFFMELIKNLEFVKNQEQRDVPSKEEFLQGIHEAVEEINLIKEGKKKAVPLHEFLNEL